MNNQQLKQFLASAEAIKSKQVTEIQDLNYFIKTIEKFSKSSNLKAESGSG